MKIKFNIFRLDYNAVETFAGYSDGYGKEHEHHPVLKPARFKDEWDTEEDAEMAIEKYGGEYGEYVIQKVYQNSPIPS